MNRKPASVSVVIPVYKCEKYIGICIESVLAQTYRDFELILVDDGSPDGAPDICDQCAAKDSRIKVIHKTNGGVSSARNAGIEAAMGEYITFIDSDDYVDAEYLQTLVAAATDTQADMVVSGLKMETWNDGNITNTVEYCFAEVKKYDVKKLLDAWGIQFPPICMCGPCCKLYNRAIIVGNDIKFAEDLNCGEDTLFNLSFLTHCSTVYALPNSFYHYRRESGDSLFSRFHKDTYEIHRRVYTKQWELMNAKQCSDATLLHFKREYFAMMIGGIHEYYRFYDETTQNEKKELLRKIASDPHVNSLKISEVKNIKDSIWLFLIKCKCFNMIMWLFKRHYKNG